MMCPKCTRRNSMLPSSFKREKRWQNADMEMNSFSIARIPMPTDRNTKTGHKYKIQEKTFFIPGSQ
jgi:mannose-6-phosphate isomerase-like protein (cupin superfamily)